jgi:hypothetical protein
MCLEMISGTRLSGEATPDALGLEENFQVSSEASHDARLSMIEDEVPDGTLSFAPGFLPRNELSESDTLFGRFGEPHDHLLSMANI